MKQLSVVLTVFSSNGLLTLFWLYGDFLFSLVLRVIDPILAIYVLYFMIIASLGMTDPKSSWIECFGEYYSNRK